LFGTLITDLNDDDPIVVTYATGSLAFKVLNSQAGLVCSHPKTNPWKEYCIVQGLS
jgi:hypothetical protein